MILQELLRLQDRYGYLPRRELAALADRLAIPLYRVREVATFYPHFRTFDSDDEERREAGSLPEFEVLVCRDMSCQLRGAAGCLQALQQLAQSSDARVQVREVPCLGRCDRAPAVRVHQRASHLDGSSTQEPGHLVVNLLGRSRDDLVATVRAILTEGPHTAITGDRDADYALPQPTSAWRIDPYRDRSPDARYQSLRTMAEQVLSGNADEHRDRIIAALRTAQLLGMGGAGGRAYKKWSEVRQADGLEKYVIGNGDESEPGTFKDRELLLRVPHLVLEAIVLGGWVIGAQRGYVYIRHEYEEAIDAIRREIADARRRGYCGDDVLGTGWSFEIEVFVSPGGYICGEQTALVQAIQDQRAEPRNRPPELQTNGLWNRPTLLNNVETLAWVPSIVTRESGTGQWYADQGCPGYQGARFFSISGDVQKPGVYEVPVGIRLGQLIDEYAGGLRDGRALKAVALSGPSGGFLPPQLPLDGFSPAVRDQIRAWMTPGATAFALRDLPLDLGVTRQLRLMLGAAIVVFAEGTDMVAQALHCLRFFQAESCGKCVPCRIGSTKLLELVEDLAEGRLVRSDVERLRDRTRSELFALAQAMAETAICGLGTSVPKPFQSLLAHFPDDVARHVRARENTS